MTYQNFSLSEVLKWDLEDLEKINNMADMKKDYETARVEYEDWKSKKEMENIK